MNHLSVLLSKQTVNSQGEPRSLQNRAESVDTIIKSIRRSHWVMARPIPDLQKVSKLAEPATIGGGGLSKASLAREQDIPYIEAFCRKKSNNNLVLGTVSGWVAGVAIIKIGKIAAFGLGGGVILLHFASECGYIDIHWEKVKESAAGSQAALDDAVRLARDNSCFCMGFLGGFFFGVAATLK